VQVAVTHYVTATYEQVENHTQSTQSGTFAIADVHGTDGADNISLAGAGGMLMAAQATIRLWRRRAMVN